MSFINSKLHVVGLGIGIARTFCWILIREVLFMLTLTACLKRYSPSNCALGSGSSPETGETAGSSGESAIQTYAEPFGRFWHNWSGRQVREPFTHHCCSRLFSGVFRIACEITMGLLRENKDTLMTVLDPFIHDPLVEWEDEKRKIVSQKKLTSTELRFMHYPGATSKPASFP